MKNKNDKISEDIFVKMVEFYNCLSRYIKILKTDCSYTITGNATFNFLLQVFSKLVIKA